MKKIILLISIFFAGFSAFSQKYSNEFLSIGVGARAQGMSKAQVASVSDVTAGYWNPAGLTQIQATWQGAAMHAEWFAGVAQFDYLAVARRLPAENSAILSFSLIRLGIDNIPYTINLLNSDGTVNYDNLSSFSAADYAGIVSYAKKLKNPDLSVGASVKLVRRVIGKIGNSWGFGTDAGIQYRPGKWQFGLLARDLTTTFNAWSFNLSQKEKDVFLATGNEIPSANTEITRPTFILGGGRKFIFSEKSSLLALADIELTTDGRRNVLVSSKILNADPRLGIEYEYDRKLQVRAGVGNFQRVVRDFDPNLKKMTLQPNFGLGLRLGRLQLDYALTDIGNVSQVLYSHIFSVMLDIREKALSARAAN